ncbi:MAG: alpha/beta hydrolase-fold protein, partial [Asticcacaulis sp.]
LHNGSMYSNSVTTGNWEGFITKDLITYIDGHYRTLATRESRGLAGHSMGGYGTLRIGMKYPEYFAAIYALSPCCLSARKALPEDVLNRLKAVTTPEQSPSLRFWDRITLASAAAWSPNPTKAPLYLDLPTGDPEADQALLARWAANAPLAMIDQYVPNLKSFTAIAIDMGDKDGLITDSNAYHQALTAYGIAHSYEIYEGDHVNRLPDRIQNHVLPFFGKHLKFSE